MTGSYPYYCVYRPNREFDSEIIDQIEEKVSKEEIFKTKSVATHYVLNKSLDSTGKTLFVDSYNSTARGMLLPTMHELTFVIRKGLAGGTNSWITTSSAWSSNSGTGHNLMRWNGTGAASYVPNSNYTYTYYNSNYNYRSYISTVIR